jgi:hypothetical protein
MSCRVLSVSVGTYEASQKGEMANACKTHSPGSLNEAGMEIDGVFDAMDGLAGVNKDNLRWDCTCSK